MTPSRVILYDRYSPRPEEPDALARLEMLADYARQQGYPTADMLRFNDEEYSRDDWERPGFQAMIRAIRKTRGALVLARNIDRIGSSGIVDWLLAETEARGGQIHTIDNGRVDPSNPMAKFMAVVLGAFAELQRDTIAQRSRAAHQRKLAEGRYNHEASVPYGWRWLGDGLVEPLAEQQALIKLILEKTADGLGIKRIAAWLNESGYLFRDGTAWTPWRVRPIVEASRPKRRKRRRVPDLGRG